MKKFIVSTTINPPTEAIRLFDRMEGWELVVVGDKKTPADYKLGRGLYMTPAMQEELDKELSDAIGWSCIQRRNMGFLHAYRQGADVVATVDDDNVPYEGWGTDLLVGTHPRGRLFKTDLPVFDPVGATNYRHLWHRGYPLQLLHKRDYSQVAAGEPLGRCDVQADFWDGDPDIDALCRMEHRPACRFEAAGFPLASNAWAPFNSQNTFLTREALRHYFMFPGIGRMDDIWGAYHLQAQGFKVVFAKPSVRQDRNVHDFTKDMVGEFLGYEKNLALVTALQKDKEALTAFLPERAAKAFTRYRSLL
ncbi:hypothetical protein EPO15_10195 [bacterium]|nr:MAG: hypothetical protein EPO15_10195 [bacterium]